MDAVFGVISAELVEVASRVLQFSPLLPGSTALEDQPDGSLSSLAMLAPGGVIERRYVLAQALRCLRPGAPFTVLAHKKRGGARLHDELSAFGCVVDDASRHHHRICRGVKPAEMAGLEGPIAAGAPQFVQEIDLWSQPGIFSWNRIDPGSQLLIEHLPPLSGRGADLGCGIGVLSTAVLAQPKVQHMTLFDIDRRGVEAARRNVDPARATVRWADVLAMQDNKDPFDFIVMNPPFHDGGAEDQNLGRSFITVAAAMLRSGGVCLLTANRHLPYEAVMQSLFSQVTLLTQERGFKIYAAVK